MVNLLKANEHTRIKLSKTIALVVLAASLAILAGGAYEGRGTISAGLAYVETLVPPWVQTGLLLALLAACAVLGWRLTADLLPRLKREWAQGRVDGSTFRSTGGSFFVKTEAHPGHAKDKVLPPWLASPDAAAAHDVLGWLTDEQDLMDGREGVRLTKHAMIREFPTAAVGAHAAEGKDMRVGEREKVMRHVSNLLKVRGEYKAVLVTFAFSNDPDRSNTLTTVNEEFSKDFARLPTKSLFFEINTRSTALTEDAGATMADSEEDDAEAGPWFAHREQASALAAVPPLPVETTNGAKR